MHIAFVGKNIVPPVWRTGNSLVPNLILDTYGPTAQPDQSSVTRDQVQMLRHGLPIKVEQPGLQDLRDTLTKNGLGDHWTAIEEACSFAKAAHGTQQRDDGSPYFYHGIRVAQIAIERFGVTDPNAIKAALLHDVLEDTSVKPDEIQRRFGGKTLEYVTLLSKPGLQANETYDQRNERYLQRLEQFGSRDLVALKLADRSDNINDTHLMPDKAKIDRYLQDTKRHYVPLAHRHFPSAGAHLEERVARIEDWLTTARL